MIKGNSKNLEEKSRISLVFAFDVRRSPWPLAVMVFESPDLRAGAGLH